MRQPKNNLLRAIQRSVIANSNEQAGNIISRRNFLTTTAKAGLAIGAASYIPFLASCNTKHKPKVVVLGAGIAGLTAAYYLQKSAGAAIDISIYDSLNRVGGRIHTDSTFLPGFTTEVGGEFIDSDHEAMHGLVKEFNLELKDHKLDNLYKDGQSEWYFIGNRRYSEAEVIKEFKGYADLIKNDKDTIAQKGNAFYVAKLDGVSLEEYFDRLQLKGWLRDLLSVAFLSEFGMSISEQSALNFISLINPDTTGGFKVFGPSDERYAVKGGNARLIEAIASRVTPVTTGYHLEAVKAKGPGFVLTFNSNKDVEADFVINTIPFKVLREVNLNIEMPVQKKKAIDELGYGNNAKLFLGFKDRAWRTKYKTPGYCFNDAVHNGWDNTWMQNNNQGPGGYTVFLGGKDAVTLAENKKNKKEMAEKYLPVLDLIYPGIKEQWSGQAEIAWWPLSKAIKGSYSAYRVGQYSTISGHEIEPVGNMFFAGEHCSSDFQGYMNGGAETGKKAALAVVKALGGKK